MQRFGHECSYSVGSLSSHSRCPGDPNDILQRCGYAIVSPALRLHMLTSIPSYPLDQPSRIKIRVTNTTGRYPGRLLGFVRCCGTMFFHHRRAVMGSGVTCKSIHQRIIFASKLRSLSWTGLRQSCDPSSTLAVEVHRYLLPPPSIPPSSSIHMKPVSPSDIRQSSANTFIRGSRRHLSSRSLCCL